MGERVLIRPEKKLVRAQLPWLDRRIRHDPARAARLLADVAPAFAEPWWTPDRSGVVLDPSLPPAAAALTKPSSLHAPQPRVRAVREGRERAGPIADYGGCVAV
ncbi:hypothetical protein [Streptomyces acidicola]|uniref:hypothetical protein n=1 Tax=Streptomyces acidicola TaxID=2596892 RepID=UPI003434DB62